MAVMISLTFNNVTNTGGHRSDLWLYTVYGIRKQFTPSERTLCSDNVLFEGVIGRGEAESDNTLKQDIIRA